MYLNMLDPSITMVVVGTRILLSVHVIYLSCELFKTILNKIGNLFIAMFKDDDRKSENIVNSLLNKANQIIAKKKSAHFLLYYQLPK